MKKLIITGDAARNAAMRYLDAVDVGTVVTFKDGDRSLEQNAMFHGLCDRIAKVLMFNGRSLSPAQWKLLIISGHAMATLNERPDIVTGFEGEVVNLRESTADMKKGRMSSLIEYTLAYMASRGVQA